MAMKPEREEFLEEFGGFFGYEIKSGQEFKEKFESDYEPHIRYENLMRFIVWYDKQLGR